jgi:hypothetical protein
VRRPIELPTIPSLPAQGDRADERAALLAGLTFVEGATSGWEAADLLGWFETFGPILHRAAPPRAVADSGIGAIALAPGARIGDKAARIESLPKLLAMTRLRVVFTLRGLLANPADDRFLSAAIFSGRVRRPKDRWMAQPGDEPFLSDIVLSLFAVDILSHRDFHEQNLCICDVCGRVSFNPSATTRAGCADHVPKSDTASGFQNAGAADDLGHAATLPPPPITTDEG